MENKIVREIEIEAPVAKVWQALTDSEKFGQWFKVKLNGPFVAGQTTIGQNLSKGFEMKMEFLVRDIRPQTYFAYAWHPYPMDKTIDYSQEKPTLVEFHLEATQTGTLLKVTESGFNEITARRRAEAFEMHSEGWEIQLRNIQTYVAG